MAETIPDPDPADFYSIKRQGRFFALYEKGDQLIWEQGPQKDRLVCVCVYKKGAEEVRRRLVVRLKPRSAKNDLRKEGQADLAADADLDAETDVTDAKGSAVSHSRSRATKPDAGMNSFFGEGEL